MSLPYFKLALTLHSLQAKLKFSWLPYMTSTPVSDNVLSFISFPFPTLCVLCYRSLTSDLLLPINLKRLAPVLWLLLHYSFCPSTLTQYVATVISSIQSALLHNILPLQLPPHSQFLKSCPNSSFFNWCLIK